MFRDRRQAGEELAKALREYANRNDVVVLGLPRGGVPVAAEVAKFLHSPLDVFLVRKLGFPGQEELAIGAIAGGGIRVLNRELFSEIDIPEDTLQRVTLREEAELERREKLYRSGKSPLSVKNKIAILVDDGLATGTTMKAAVMALREFEPEKIVVAVPVGSRSACRDIERLSDEFICLSQPSGFVSVGMHYENFGQTSDEEVLALLS